MRYLPSSPHEDQALLDAIGVPDAEALLAGIPASARLGRELALPAALGRYGDCLENYAEEREAAGSDAPTVEELIERLGGARLMERIRSGDAPPGPRFRARAPAVCPIGHLLRPRTW